MSELDVKHGELSPTLVRASAGTGKTYQLTARYLKLLIQGVAPETILATTFTRKAAGEILSRILTSLAKAAEDRGEEHLAKIREQVDIPTLPRSCCMQLTEKLLQNIHRLRVSTLDSLFTQLAKSFPFELSLPAAWRLSDEIEEVWLRERAVEMMIAQLDQAEIASLMSMLGKGEIRRSVSGELVQVVEWAYSKQRSCKSDIWLSMNVPRRPDDSRISSAVSDFRAAKPKQKRLLKKLISLADTLESGDDEVLVHETLVKNYHQSRLKGEPLTYYGAEFPEGLNEAFSTLYLVAKSKHLALLQMQNAGTGELLRAYDKHIGESKEAARMLSFEDIAVRLAALFRQRTSDYLLSRVDGTIDHLLLDEFQDTSPIQWQVLYPFALRTTQPQEITASESATGMETGKTFFCVGDTKQAIYGWRGGVAEIFDTVAEQLPNIDQVNQNKSWRSSPVLMESINRIFKNLPRHPIADRAQDSDPSEKEMHEGRALRKFAENFPEHLAANQDLHGFVQLTTAIMPDHADSSARKSATFEKATEIAADLLEQDPTLSIGVLTRTNRAVAELIYRLEQSGLDVSQEGGNPLTDSAAVEMVLSALMLAEHPEDLRWKYHLTASPLSAVEGFGPEWVRMHIDEFGLAETVELLSGCLAPVCDARETLRLKQLCYLAIDYDLNVSPRLRDFVRMVREKRIDRPRAAPVRVMTVHQSKGLEFDAVIVVEMDSSLSRQSTDCVSRVEDLMQPPTGMTRYVSQKTWHFLSREWQNAFGKQAADSFTESLCMWYVALTRAKQGLYMVVQPQKKPEFNARTFGSLVFHALRIEEDPTQDNTVLYQAGDENWFEQNREESNDEEVFELSGGKSAEPIVFQPVKGAPRRHCQLPS